MIEFDRLFERQQNILKRTPEKFRRSIYYEIPWDNRIIEIRGARGVGKTTLMLQKIKEIAKDKNIMALYVSADDPLFFTNTLYDFADEFYKIGGTHLFIDEIHRYPAKQNGYDWSAEIKYIYDSYPQLQIVYSGSSILELYRGFGDLSRRRIYYKMNGLSFREYLEFTGIGKFEILSLEQILTDHYRLASEITEKIRILAHFKTYLKTGYYPIFKETKREEEYYQLLREIINIVIENDLPKLTNIEFITLNKLKRLLGVVATSSPYTAEIKRLSELLKIKDYKSLLRLIDLLDKAELFMQLKQRAQGVKILHKPDKIYLNNNNLIYALDFGGINIGTVRETFFLNQVRYKHTVHYPKTADFLVDDNWLFEIGGKGKTQKQIAGQQDAYIAADDIEIGFNNKLPLWMFGFLY